jgi:Uma2 family endonuclease
MATLTEPHPDRLADAPRLVFDGVSWDDYEAMLRIVGDRPIRVTYDRGRMEIMPPMWAHGGVSDRLGWLIHVLIEELDLPAEGADPVTFKRQDLEKGVEPDKCYYFGPHAALVRGKERLEMGIDPPPDLVIEADITSSSLDRPGIFAALGIPEVWRFTRRSLQFLHLQPDGTYRPAEVGRAFPWLKVADVARFLEQGRTMEKAPWIRSFRAFVRAELAPRAGGDDAAAGQP